MRLYEEYLLNLMKTGWKTGHRNVINFEIGSNVRIIEQAPVARTDDMEAPLDSRTHIFSENIQFFDFLDL